MDDELEEKAKINLQEFSGYTYKKQMYLSQ